MERSINSYVNRVSRREFLRKVSTTFAALNSNLLTVPKQEMAPLPNPRQDPAEEQQNGGRNPKRPVFSPKPETQYQEPVPAPEAEKPWTSTAKITSYCLRGSLTRSETPVREGVVATDPRVIPLGSLIDIEGLGEGFIAEDTGSAVKGWHIDVWSSSCSWSINWGVQQRNVRVIRWGWD